MLTCKFSRTGTWLILNTVQNIFLHDKDVVHHDLVFGVYRIKIHGLGDAELFSQFTIVRMLGILWSCIDKCVGLLGPRFDRLVHIIIASAN
jgi:hypothetical protein